MSTNSKYQNTKIPKHLNYKIFKKKNTIDKTRIRNSLLTFNFSLSTYRRGIALLVAIGTMIVIFIIGALAIYLITRGLGITIGQTRYETAYEASVASLEIGSARAEYLNQALAISDTTEVIDVGEYRSTLNVERTSNTAIVLSGTALKFAQAVSGPGRTPSTGSYRTYYIRTRTIGRSGEQVSLEVLERHTILTE